MKKHHHNKDIILATISFSKTIFIGRTFDNELSNFQVELQQSKE